jgi:hypothetical protein
MYFIHGFYFFFVLNFLFISASHATEYFVSPKGSASWANCKSINTPCSAATAMTNAVAGDIVLFMDGIYDVYQDGNYQTPDLNVAHRGTESNPITLKSLNKYGAIIRGHGTSSSPISATVIGAYQRNYIVWDGFFLTARNQNNNANIYATARFDAAYGCKLINSKLQGGVHSSGGATNNAGVFFQNANYLTIQNNIFYEYREASNNENNSAIHGYPSSFVTIKNNEIYNSTNAINL